MKKIKFIAIVFFAFFLSNVIPSWAINEDKVISSAEKVVNKWEEVLMKGVYIVSLTAFCEKDTWKVNKPTPIKGSFSYDIRKTDSIITPYQLIISFKSLIGENKNSPNANSTKIEDKWSGTIPITTTKVEVKCGFKTIQDALNHIEPTDFKNKTFDNKDDHIFDLVINYSFQKNSWIFKGGNREFMAYIGYFIEGALKQKENDRYFKDLIEIPVK